MSDDFEYVCHRCGEKHAGLPYAYGGAYAPDYWNDELANDETSLLDEELCVIGGENFFVRARIILPVIDEVREFEWGVWVSLSHTNFERTVELWTAEGREQEPSYFGFVATTLPTYEPTTLELKSRVHTRPVGERPVVELEPTDHPLAVEQRDGITRARVQEIAEAMLHA